jgi:hypothetical protein
MKKETVKKLNDILDIADDIIDIDEPLEIQKAPAVEITTTDLTSDYDFSRDQYHNIIEKGNEALVELLAIAKEGEQLMNSLAATTKELLILQKTKKEVEGTNKPTKNENNLFIGSTSELQKLLDMKKKK